MWEEQARLGTALLTNYKQSTDMSSSDYENCYFCDDIQVSSNGFWSHCALLDDINLISVFVVGSWGDVIEGFSRGSPIYWGAIRLFMTA